MRILGLLVMLLITAACAVSGPVYTQPDLPPEQVAVLEGGAPLVLGGLLGVSYRVSIDQVDGQHAGTYGKKREVKLTPGVHSVTLSYFRSGYQTTYTGRPIPIRFNAQAGRTYRAMAAEEGGRWMVWIEDAKTGEVVAGKKP